MSTDSEIGINALARTVVEMGFIWCWPRNDWFIMSYVGRCPVIGEELVTARS